VRTAEVVRYLRGPFPKVRAALKAYRLETDMAHRSFPGLVQVQTINACNASCVMCPYGRTPDSRTAGRMDEGLWDKVVHEIAERTDVDVFIPMLQNEPFLDARILDKIAAFKQRTGGRVRAELVTHGGLLTPAVVERLAGSDLDKLTISMDSINRETYERIRIGLDFDVVMSNVQRLIDARPRTTIEVRMVHQALNRTEGPAFLAFWRQRGVEAAVWDVENRQGAVRDFESLAVPDGRSWWTTKISGTLLRTFTPRCPVPFYAAYILHNGDVLACGFDWWHESVVGNVREQTLREVWNGDEMRQLRRRHFEKRIASDEMCGRCSMWKKYWASAAAAGDAD
jgi:radical SAM protein with 4Fe4S-binding SPASM domain